MTVPPDLDYAFRVLGGGSAACLVLLALCAVKVVVQWLKDCVGMPIQLILLGTWRPGKFGFARWPKENWWWRDDPEGW